MKKGGIGVGSASIVLVFAVLCLTVFSLITFVVAGNDSALVEAEAQLVKGYYEADTLAEHIVAQIIQSDATPDTVRGIDIKTGVDDSSGAEIAYFFCPVSDIKDLYVRLAIRDGSYDILSWKLCDTNEWVVDDSLSVWQGSDEMEIGNPMEVWSGLGQWEDE